MKKLLAVVLFLFAIETYGVFGAMQARRVIYTCTIEIGPLCYAWEENVLVKALGSEAAEKLEERLAQAKKVWEQDFIERTIRGDKGGLNEALEKAGDLAHDSLEAAKKALEGKKE